VVLTQGRRDGGVAREVSEGCVDLISCAAFGDPRVATWRASVCPLVTLSRSTGRCRTAGALAGVLLNSAGYARAGIPPCTSILFQEVIARLLLLSSVLAIRNRVCDFARLRAERLQASNPGVGSNSIVKDWETKL
jgi:hypothetical protein